MSDNEPIWQVNVDGKIYETDLEMLKQWIAEGKVGPTDPVRKGTLSWIAANRAPALRGAFPVGDSFSSSPNRASTIGSPSALQSPLAPKASTAAAGPGGDPIPAQPGASACHNHPELPPDYVCRICGATCCKDCPQFVASSRIPTCPLCGDMCIPVGEAKENEATTARQVTAGPSVGSSSSFGLGDFGRALRYPLKHPLGLVAIAVFYEFLRLGGIKTHLIALSILFACLSLVIKQIAWGRFERSFIPDFNDFSLADDVLGPAVLGLGTALVTFGPFLMLLLAILTGWIGTGAPAVAGAPQVQIGPENSPLTAEDLHTLINSENPEKDEATMKKLQQLHPAAQAKATIRESTPPSQADSMMEIARPLLNSTGLVTALGMLSLGWALVYYPMALAVAGYSEDFWSVINPMVGLDTIRRMGLVYAKAFCMYVGIQTIGFGLVIIVTAATAPLALPLLGNLPARFIGGVITFYCSLVVACILGLALHKCAGRLNIPTD